MPARKTSSSRRKQPAPRKVVVTAGPTREYVDPVRYISNESSGTMGFAIARAAAERGDEVVLIAGPVHQETPEGVRRIDIHSARELLAAVKAEFKDADLLIMAAAVADWRPKRKLAGKWRAKDGGNEETSIELVRNPDVLATVAKNKGERVVVAFALETGDGERRALAKLKRKNADYVLLNDASALGAQRSSATILGVDGSRQELHDVPKRKIAQALVKLERPVVEPA